MTYTHHREMTDPENKEVLGTLTPRAWRRMVTEDVASRVFKLPPKGENTREHYVRAILDVDAGKLFMDIARLSSGSIKGEARKDLRDVLVGAQPQGGSLTVANIMPQGKLTPKDATTPGY